MGAVYSHLRRPVFLLPAVALIGIALGVLVLTSAGQRDVSNGLDPAFPHDFPVAPGARLLSSAVSSANHQVVSANWATSSAPADVVAFYSALRAGRWTAAGPSLTFAGGPTQVAFVDQRSETSGITVSIVGRSGGSVVSAVAVLTRVAASSATRVGVVRPSLPLVTVLGPRIPKDLLPPGAVVVGGTGAKDSPTETALLNVPSTVASVTAFIAEAVSRLYATTPQRVDSTQGSVLSWSTPAAVGFAVVTAGTPTEVRLAVQAR